MLLRFLRAGSSSIFKMLLAVLCLSLISCGGEERPLNVLLIGVDTLRSDHLSCYGYERDTSPYLTEFAAESVLFENAVSQCPWTLPSFASFFTSLYPTQNGTGSFMNKMRTSFPTLAEIVAEAGYATGAIVNVPLLRPEFGALRGFEYQDLHITGLPRIADQVTIDALEWIDANSRGPFLLFAHYFDPHFPYTPPSPYDTLYGCGLRGGDDLASAQHRGAGARPAQAAQLDSYTAEDRQYLIDLYDGEIRFTDAAVSDLVRGLEDRGLRERTLIVFMSDHGEEFFEHGGAGHGHSVYSELLRVPLIISLPGKLREGVRVSRQVRLIDVTPTILDMLGLDASPGMEGVSLAGLLTGAGSRPDGAGDLFAPEVAFAEAMQRGPEKKSVVERSYKLIYDMGVNRKKLFNLNADPGEFDDIAAREPDLAASMELKMLEGMLAMSGTWYIKMVSGGETHTFDARVSSGAGENVGRVHAVDFLDSEGRRISPDQVKPVVMAGGTLELRGLETDGSVVVAFKPEAPGRVPVKFDLEIDGRPAEAGTFTGAKGKSPGKMPFTRLASRVTTPTAGGPEDAPPAPCFQIWFAEGEFAGQADAEIEDATRRELRSLGYIQ